MSKEWNFFIWKMIKYQKSKQRQPSRDHYIKDSKSVNPSNRNTGLYTRSKHYMVPINFITIRESKIVSPTLSTSGRVSFKKENGCLTEYLEQNIIENIFLKDSCIFYIYINSPLPLQNCVRSLHFIRVISLTR